MKRIITLIIMLSVSLHFNLSALTHSAGICPTLDYKLKILNYSDADWILKINNKKSINVSSEKDGLPGVTKVMPGIFLANDKEKCDISIETSSLQNNKLKLTCETQVTMHDSSNKPLTYKCSIFANKLSSWAIDKNKNDSIDEFYFTQPQTGKKYIITIQRENSNPTINKYSVIKIWEKTKSI